jgi:hypothetical protein
MKMLIAVKSCEKDKSRGAHDLIRETWGQDVSAAGGELKFFTARSGTPDLDEVIVNAPDDYAGLPYKTREIVRYALANNYDYVLLCDTSTVIFFRHLMAYDFMNYDYIGCWGMEKQGPFLQIIQAEDGRNCPTTRILDCYPWAAGPGYILSRKAMKIVAENEPTVWAEDCWVGQVLAKNGIFLEDRYCSGFKGHVVDWDRTEHEYQNTPDLMVRRRRWMENCYKNMKEVPIEKGLRG